MSAQGHAILVKAVSLVFGLGATGLAFACEPLGGLLKVAVSLMGTIAGPLVGLFTLAILVPWANKYGAIFGTVVSEVFLIWICIGNYMFNPYGHYRLETRVDNCSAEISPNITGLFNKLQNQLGIKQISSPLSR